MSLSGKTHLSAGLGQQSTHRERESLDMNKLVGSLSSTDLNIELGDALVGRPIGEEGGEGQRLQSCRHEIGRRWDSIQLIAFQAAILHDRLHGTASLDGQSQLTRPRVGVLRVRQVRPPALPQPHFVLIVQHEQRRLIGSVQILLIKLIF